MLSRRTLIVGTAALAAGCGFLKSPLSAPGSPQPTALNWVSGAHLGLSDRLGTLRPKEILQQSITALQDDEENPHGPKRGRYQLTLRYVEYSAIPSDYPAWLEEIEADLVTVHAGNAKALAESGLWLPLDQFMGTADPELEAAFFPSAIEQFRHGALYALPVDARPLMLSYDAEHFAREQVPPPTDGSWNWDDLVENAVKLTRRREDGTPVRWGLGAHSNQVWWALWQNQAEAVDPDTLQCRLQEPAAIEALQFIRGLIHSHGVSPQTINWEFPPAMVYAPPPWRPSYGDYRLAALPRGKVQAVPVFADMGIAIAARTENAETAYTALKGLVHALQTRVGVPAEREAVARLGEYRTDLRPEEIAALQHSMEHGRGMPQNVPALFAMDSVVKGLVRGDEVASVINEACSVAREYQQA